MSHDSGLYKSFAMVLGALVLFTLIIIFLANIFSPPTDYSADPLIANSVKKQIAPVGQSNVRSDAQTGQTAADAAAPAAKPDEAATATATATETAAIADEPRQAEEATATVAAVDTAAEPASAEPEVAADPVTVNSTLEVPLNVRAIVATNCAGCHENGVGGAQRNDDVAAWQAIADQGIEALTASVIAGKGSMPARAETTLDDAELQLAVQHMINKNLGGASSQKSGVAETTEAAATVAASTESVEKVVETVAQPVAENVKVAVDTICAACHISGVGNAPKYGDKEAWSARMADGIDAVAARAIAGKGAMPPRGGSQLSDDEIKQAIQYMLTK